MPRTVDIPGGQATLRTPDEIRERDRRLITSSSMAASDIFGKVPPEMAAALQDAKTPADVEKVAVKFGAKLKLSRQDTMLLSEIQDASILAFLKSWTLPQPVPTTIEEVQDLQKDLYDALATATKDDAAAIAESNFAARQKMDDSPTGPSSASNGSLGDKPSTSIPASSGATALSSGGGSSPA